MTLTGKLILAWFILACPVFLFTQVHMWREAFFEGERLMMVANVLSMITVSLSFAAALDNRQNQ